MLEKCLPWSPWRRRAGARKGQQRAPGAQRTASRGAQGSLSLIPLVRGQSVLCHLSAG